jgi:hypothetical protein
MKQSKRIRYQRGAALLLIAAAMIVAASVLSYQLLGGLGAKLKRQNAQEMSQALADAKENLLAFADNIPEIYTPNKSLGFLPCPDLSALSSITSGTPSPTCSWASSTALGRFPAQYKTNYFFFSTPQKEGGYSLWYAISDPLRNGAVANPVYDYDTTKTTITLDNGVGLAAIVIAAGDPIANQINRDATIVANLQWDQYLESMTTANINNGKFSTPSTLPVGTVYNDKVITITLADFQSQMKANVCARAITNDWCTNVTNYNASAWFKNFNWGFSTGSVPRICTGTPLAPTGINTTECP